MGELWNSTSAHEIHMFVRDGIYSVLQKETLVVHIIKWAPTHFFGSQSSLNCGLLDTLEQFLNSPAEGGSAQP